MFPFDPPETIRKPLVFLCFQGDQKRTLASKGLKVSTFKHCIVSILPMCIMAFCVGLLDYYMYIFEMERKVKEKNGILTKVKFQK